MGKFVSSALAQQKQRISLSKGVCDALALSLLTAICVVLVINYYGKNAFDDSFVGYAYARSVASGQGYIFDHGPGSLLSTSAPLAVPLYALVAHIFKIDIVQVAQIISALCIFIITYSSYFIFRKYVMATGAFIATAALILSPCLQSDWVS